MDMSQYKRMFGTTRIPLFKIDKIRYGCDSDSFSKHIIVTRNGNVINSSRILEFI